MKCSAFGGCSGDPKHSTGLVQLNIISVRGMGRVLSDGTSLQRIRSTCFNVPRHPHMAQSSNRPGAAEGFFPLKKPSGTHRETISVLAPACFRSDEMEPDCCCQAWRTKVGCNHDSKRQSEFSASASKTIKHITE